MPFPKSTSSFFERGFSRQGSATRDPAIEYQHTSGEEGWQGGSLVLPRDGEGCYRPSPCHGKGGAVLGQPVTCHNSTFGRSSSCSGGAAPPPPLYLTTFIFSPKSQPCVLGPRKSCICNQRLAEYFKPERGSIAS